MSSMPARRNMLPGAAGDLRGISASISEGNAAAVSPTTDVKPAAADVVSALVAAQFAAHAHAYQAVSNQVAAEQTLLADTLGTSTGVPAGTEAAWPLSRLLPRDEVVHGDSASRPLLAAAAAWNGLAANLHSAANSYAHLISKVTERHWQDPVAASMAAGATHHVAWLSSLASHAKQAAAQAEHAAEWFADRLFHTG